MLTTGTASLARRRWRAEIGAADAAVVAFVAVGSNGSRTASTEVQQWNDQRARHTRVVRLDQNVRVCVFACTACSRARAVCVCVCVCMFVSARELLYVVLLVITLLIVRHSRRGRNARKNVTHGDDDVVATSQTTVGERVARGGRTRQTDVARSLRVARIRGVWSRHRACQARGRRESRDRRTASRSSGGVGTADAVGIDLTVGGDHACRDRQARAFEILLIYYIIAYKVNGLRGTGPR